MNRKLTYQILFGLILGIALFWVGTQVTSQPYTYQGSVIDPPAPAADFTLEMAGGGTFRLSDYRGKVILLYFGYTFCPDVCPTTLYDLSRVKEDLGELGDELIVVMTTVDPKRDTLDKLGSYVSTFEPTFIGLSGSQDSLQAVWADYGVYRAEKPVEGSAAYFVDHTARVYVIDRDGNLRMTFPFGMSWQAMRDDLSHLMEQ